MDYMEMGQRLLNANLYGVANHIGLSSITEDEVVAYVDLSDEQKNPYGLAHGGVYFTLMDSACGMLARVDGRRYVTLDAQIHYLMSTKTGRITGTGHIVRRGRSTTVVEMTIRDEHGTALTNGTVTMYCLDPDKKPFKDV